MFRVMKGTEENTIRFSKSINVLLLLSLFGFMSFLFVSVFSSSTSPFYSSPYMDDSGIFLLIGKGWTEGKIPYLDLWDNKGPLLYLINAIGFWLTGDKYGVYILQVVNLTLSLYVIYRIFRVNYGCRVSCIGTVASLLWLTNAITNNNPAEWLLIPLCLSFYLLYKWLKDYPQKKLSWKYSIIWGSTIGCGFLLRFSDCSLLFVSLCVVALFMSYDGIWKEVFRHVVICLVGFGLIILPFLVYYYSKHGLEEIWYASFAHNLEYVVHSRAHFYSLYALGSFVLSYALFIGVILTGLLIMVFRLPSTRVAVVWLISSIITLAFLSQTYARGTYSVASMPLFCFVVFQTDELLKKAPLLLVKCCWGIMVLFIAATSIFQISQEIIYDKQSKDLQVYKVIEDEIPTSDYHSFSAFDIIPDIYVYTSLKPVHRFFIVYSGCLQVDDSLIERIRAEYLRKKAKWVLVRKTGYKVCIQDILDQNYDIYKSFIQGYTLYHLKK